MRAILVALVSLLTCAAAPAADVIHPIDRVDPYVAVPGGKALADNTRPYRVLFEARRGADKPDQLSPAVNMAGSEINTLAAHKVLRSHVQFVVVFHTTASNEAVLDNAHYRAKYGVDNPNLPVLAQLQKEGVKLFVCGQTLLGDNVPLNAVTKEVTVAEDGVVVIMDYAGRGYAHLTF